MLMMTERRMPRCTATTSVRRSTCVGFTGGHLARYVRLLPKLLERVRLGRLVTTYLIEDYAVAMRAVRTDRS